MYLCYVSVVVLMLSEDEAKSQLQMLSWEIWTTRWPYLCIHDEKPPWEGSCCWQWLVLSLRGRNSRTREYASRGWGYCFFFLGVCLILLTLIFTLPTLWMYYQIKLFFWKQWPTIFHHHYHLTGHTISEDIINSGSNAQNMQRKWNSKCICRTSIPLHSNGFTLWH